MMQVFASCQTDHQAGWLSGLVAQLRAPGRRLAGENDHKHDMHDPIVLYANKVGPSLCGHVFKRLPSLLARCTSSQKIWPNADGGFPQQMGPAAQARSQVAGVACVSATACPSARNL